MSQPFSPGEQQEKEPQNPDVGSDTYVERMAAHNRLIAETNLTMKQWEEYWTKTRDTTERQLDAVEQRIGTLVGPDRDDISGLDDEMLEIYKTLRGQEQNLKWMNNSAREMLDKIATCTTPEDLEPKS